MIEREEQGTTGITTPFNPNMIKIRRDPFTLGQLIDKMQYNEVRFDTPFQRKADLWDDVKQSRLVESLLLRLPLPAFYFDEPDENKQVWNVIDGLQRCSVFKKFILEGQMPLKGLEYLAEQYGTYTYGQLPRELQRRIMQTPLTVYVIEAGTPEEVKFNIFKRINTGGLVLNSQEIRHAMNQGIAADTIAAMAEMDSFKRATGGIKSNRMEDQDFVTRYVAFYLQDYREYKPDLDGFMTKGMEIVRGLTVEKIEKMKADFEKAMKTAYLVFGRDAFRKRENPADKRKPINKALFEVLSVTLAQLEQTACDRLIERKECLAEYFMMLNRDVKFSNSLSSGTGQKENVIFRFTEIEKLIHTILVES